MNKKDSNNDEEESDIKTTVVNDFLLGSNHL